MIAENLSQISKSIKATCKKFGRNESSIKFVAVSKKKSFKEIESACKLGLNNFGENYVQELKEKIALNNNRLPINWHFIGHLQSNKVKEVVGQVDLIHSIDRDKILNTVNKRANDCGLIQNVLLQVNLAEEASKGGFSKAEVEKIVDSLSDFKSLNILGLMFFPPQVKEDQLREFYNEASLFFDAMKGKVAQTSNEFSTLSMGTTHDYKIAIEKGSTMVRIGSALFGERT